MADTTNLDVGLQQRPKKEAASEILGASVVAMTLVLVAAALSGWTEGWAMTVRFASTAGEVVLQHIGWAFSAYIPVLLGFYAIVIGGQLSTDQSSAFRIRRTLGFTAEVLTGALMPAVVLIIVACINNPTGIGALVAIYIGVLSLVAHLFAFQSPTLAIAILAAIAFSAVSTVRLRKRAPRFFVNWTLQGGATGRAAKSIRSTHRRSEREIDELRLTETPNKSMTARSRIVAVIQAFRGNTPAAAQYRPEGQSG